MVATRKFRAACTPLRFAVGQTVDGFIDVGDVAVTMVIELPGVLGIIARNLKDRLQKVGQRLLTKQ
jgi:hypothetical protein